MFKNTKNKQNNLKIVLFFISIGAILYIFSTPSLYDKLFSKFFVENSSTTSRFGAISINLSIAFRDLFHPFLGNGFSYVEQNFLRIGNELFLSDVHNTNTSLKILSVYGIFYFLVYVYSMVKFCHKTAKDAITFIGLVIALFFVLSNEDMIMNILGYLIIFYADNAAKKEISSTETESI